MNAKSNNKSNIAKFVAIKLNGKGGWKYVAIMQDGSQEVVRANATRLYNAAHNHSGNVNSGKPAGLPSTVTFGVHSGYPQSLIGSYPVELVDALPEIVAATAAPAPEAKAPKAPRTNTYAALKSKHSGKSSIDSPTFVAWTVFNDKLEASRKDAIAAAVAAGVSYHTARTQYQLWLAASRAS